MNLNRRTVKKLLMVSSAVLVVFAIGFFAVMAGIGIREGNNPANPTENPVLSGTAPGGASQTSQTSAPSEPPATEPPVTYREITLAAAGDLTLYESMWESARAYGGGAFDFSELTKYVKDIISSYDYAAINFEGTVAAENEAYSAYPTFHVPWEVLKTVKSSGFDMALFANNHTYDGGHGGLLLTQQRFAENGLAWIGTRLSESEKSYGVYDVQGIKLGMLNYTYESPPDYEKDNRTQKFLNGIRLDARDIPLVDSFYEGYLSGFYEELRGRIQEMKQEGAQFIIVFLHWGEEYENAANPVQRAIAQKLCDEGVDLLIGSHPHVVQPVETFTAAESGKKMLCYYSLGNFISAQNRLTFSESFYDTGFYAENGLIAGVTIRQYSTGETVISKADYVATWMHRHSVDGRIVFNVVPLAKALAGGDSEAQYGLTESSFGSEHAHAAMEYLTGLIQPGIDAFQKENRLPHEEAEPEGNA